VARKKVVDTFEPDPAELEAALNPAPKRKAKAADKMDKATLTTLAEPYDTDGDLVDIWERRMLNPNARQTKPVRLKTPGMHLRWINLAQPGRYQRARYDEGWVPVVKSELVDEREIFGVSYTNEGWVCRGEKQSEMLMKIPEAVWKKIRDRRVAIIREQQRNLKSTMRQAGGQHFADKYNTNRGDEIADSIGNFKGDIKFGVERVEEDPGDLGLE
jgi:hypothetical protein